jgi:hypothetical protein
VLAAKSFTAAGRSFTAKAVVKMGENPDDHDSRVNYYSLTLISPKLGTKKLFTSEDHSKDDYWFMLDAGVLGVIKSPFEDRVAVVGMQVMRGWEGPPHTGDLRIVGASLKPW